MSDAGAPGGSAGTGYNGLNVPNSVLANSGGGSKGAFPVGALDY
jgi:hypothetical protein